MSSRYDSFAVAMTTSLLMKISCES